MEEVRTTEQDLADVLRARVNEVTSLQVQVATLSRTIKELTEKLEAKEADDAEGG